MLFGKAWTTIPGIENPTISLIEVLREIFEDITPGSVVVAASDVILSMKGKFNFQGGVVGLAVPTELKVAKNHGVFICSNQEGLQNVDLFLQKPSIERMEKEGCVNVAWVDSGEELHYIFQIFLHQRTHRIINLHCNHFLIQQV